MEGMEVIIESPSFYDEEDENVFFNCIYALPGFVTVKGRGINLLISFSEPITNEAIKQLVVICRRWNIDISTLLSYKNESNDYLELWYSNA